MSIKLMAQNRAGAQNERPAPHPHHHGQPVAPCLSLFVLGLPTAPVETPEAEALYVSAAGEKVRLARAIETGGIAKARLELRRLKYELEKVERGSGGP